MIVFFPRSDWLLNQWLSCTIHWFTSSSSERATPNSRKLRAKCLSQLKKKRRRRRWRSSVWKLCLFDSNLSIKPVKKCFVYKCKLSLSFGLLYLVDLFINKLKTKFNNLFYRIISNTNRIHNSFWRNFPARAKQTPSKVLFVGKKKRRPRPFGH